MTQHFGLVLLNLRKDQNSNLAGKHWVTEFGGSLNNKVKDFVKWWQNLSVADKTTWFEKSKALGFNIAPADSEEATGKRSRGGSRKKKKSPHGELHLVLRHISGLPLSRSLLTPLHAVLIISIIT
ncbi:hypothetical protein NP233_g9728 [Leucocoprinus birnbaumii]|uniref:Uncharacterized protein n=1 Tax=Leucocoprinus birnbaumii TaxID=56174 RepID=A0AAD5YSK3_9AGAR|nr:hypothetical protein NP233_g9728 [Leucocoprinus birnbaumii]